MSFTHFKAIIRCIRESKMATAIMRRMVRDLGNMWVSNDFTTIRSIEAALPLEMRQDIMTRRATGLQTLKPTIVFPASRLATVAA